MTRKKLRKKTARMIVEKSGKPEAGPAPVHLLSLVGEISQVRELVESAGGVVEIHDGRCCTDESHGYIVGTLAIGFGARKLRSDQAGMLRG
jgi:hypothetical protein